MVAPPSRPFHWPGGIPPEIKANANDVTIQQANEEAKGWLLFVEEQWVSRANANVSDEDGDYEVRQRRALVESWAKASQEFRDSYHQRAPARNAMDYPSDAVRNAHLYYDTPSFVCLPPLGLSFPSNQSKWIKLYILSCRLDGEMDHCMQSHGARHGSLDPNPATISDPTKVQITDVLPRAFLEMANFAHITMTRQGTVLFMGFLWHWFLVTDDDLNTGHITVVDFKRNGQIDQCLRRRAFNMWPVYLDLFTGNRPLIHVIDDRIGGSQRMNSEYVTLTSSGMLAYMMANFDGSLDMNLPVIDILEGAKARGEFLDRFDGARDGWTEDIEIYAPGYLEMEAAGREAEYDHARLIDPEDAYDIRSALYRAQILSEL
ncbi:hypothetical protein N7494_001722 [Penicillium frequentans]|uniref:Uncharacterized protein n=1 Tax=Penicillium frequentans TaxID=3151616 RepID=A0AAD6D2I4_9EURO|nr:hypothetical protein N7494_001722 [Penicillium glabrum]